MRNLLSYPNGTASHAQRRTRKIIQYVFFHCLSSHHCWLTLSLSYRRCCTNVIIAETHYAKESLYVFQGALAAYLVPKATIHHHLHWTSMNYSNKTSNHLFNPPSASVLAMMTMTLSLVPTKSNILTNTNNTTNHLFNPSCAMMTMTCILVPTTSITLTNNSKATLHHPLHLSDMTNNNTINHLFHLPSASVQAMMMTTLILIPTKDKHSDQQLQNQFFKPNLFDHQDLLFILSKSTLTKINQAWPTLVHDNHQPNLYKQYLHHWFVYNNKSCNSFVIVSYPPLINLQHLV